MYLTDLDFCVALMLIAIPVLAAMCVILSMIKRWRKNEREN